jgi:hypothetical protein
MRCRMILTREGTIIDHVGAEGETYAEALLSHCIIPDTVLIFYKGKSLPEDAPIEQEEVEIVTTGSRG